MRVILIRHGEAESNLDVLERMIGAPAELTQEGIRQITATAINLGKLAIDTNVIYCSPYERTRQSAEIIASKLGLSVVEDERLEEISRGIWEGRPVRDFMDVEAGVDIDERHLFRPKDGENWEDVGHRVVEFIQEKQESGYQDLVLVSHDHPIKMGVGKLMGLPVVEWEDLPADLASITILRYKNNRWRIDTETHMD